MAGEQGQVTAAAYRVDADRRDLQAVDRDLAGVAPRVPGDRPGPQTSSRAPKGPETPAKPIFSSASQFAPYRAGVLTRPTRLVPKTAAATSAAMAMVVPASALRTGTAVRPRPGSNAIRMPSPVVTGPAAVSAVISGDGRVRPAVGSATTGGPAARRSGPPGRQGKQDEGEQCDERQPGGEHGDVRRRTPGSGSASRAGPIGISGEAATATATARTAPVPVTMASLAMERASRLRAGHADGAQHGELGRLKA